MGQKNAGDAEEILKAERMAERAEECQKTGTSDTYRHICKIIHNYREQKKGGGPRGRGNAAASHSFVPFTGGSGIADR